MRKIILIVFFATIYPGYSNGEQDEISIDELQQQWAHIAEYSPFFAAQVRFDMEKTYLEKYYDYYIEEILSGSYLPYNEYAERKGIRFDQYKGIVDCVAAPIIGVKDWIDLREFTIPSDAEKCHSVGNLDFGLRSILDCSSCDNVIRMCNFDDANLAERVSCVKEVVACRDSQGCVISRNE